jgi:hypothetical protein
MGGPISVWSFAQAFRGQWFAAMSGGFSVPFAALAVFLDNKYQQVIFGCLAFAAIWYAAYTIWRIEREKVLKLEERVNGTKRLEPIAEHLREAQELQHRKISNDEDLKKIVSDYNAFLTAAVDYIERNFSAAEAQAFGSRPTVYAAFIPGSFNDTHTNLRLFLAEYAGRLSDIIKRYGPR